MRRDKLVEMVKAIGREKLDERSHMPSARHANDKRLRTLRGLKLAQEEKNIVFKAETGGNTVVTLEPTLNSLSNAR